MALAQTLALLPDSTCLLSRRAAWGGTAQYNKSATAQIVAAYVKWTDNVVNYQDGSSIIFWTYSPNVRDIVIRAAYEDTQGNEAPSGFDNFMAIPRAADTLRVDSHGALTDELAHDSSGYRFVKPVICLLTC